MLEMPDLQYAIHFCAWRGMESVMEKAFMFTGDGWRPRPGCLTAKYPPNEAIICSFLLEWYFHMDPTSEEATSQGPVTSTIWEGAEILYLAVIRNIPRWDAERREP